ncbi:MAG: hypothetical protein ACK4KT_08750 [Thermaurantimonas sp.]
MLYLRQILKLLRTDFKIEWREKHQFFSLLLYITSSAFIAYMMLKSDVAPRVSISVFWIVLGFGAVTITSRSLIRETSHRFVFYYQTTPPTLLIVSKILFNCILLTIISWFTTWLFDLLFQTGFPIRYLMTISTLGALAFGTTLTLIAGISASAQGNAAIMAVLSFPLLLPQLLILIRISEALLISAESGRFILASLLVDGITLVLSIVLFQFLWKE